MDTNSEMEDTIVRGIKHTNRLNDTDCQPEVIVTNGGINEEAATLKITSERGCGLNSYIEFYIQRQ